MKEVTPSNFGLLIAFLLPGFMVLWGASYFSETVALWLSGSNASAPTVGGFMYVTLASVAAGVTVSTVRWAVIDSIHRWTGLPQPRWDFSRLQENLGAYNILNEIHYKFYLFHGNSLVALAFVYVAKRIHEGRLMAPVGWFDVGCLLLAIILFAGSRDTLRKYDVRVSQLLKISNPSDRFTMQSPAHRPARQPLLEKSARRNRDPHNWAAQRSFKN